MSNGSVTEYLQEQLDQAYRSGASNEEAVARERNWRRTLAYGFKCVAVLGGLIITFGVSEKAAHIIGFGIAIIVALDGIFSNYRRLLTVAAATNAYRSLLRAVRQHHQRDLAPILKQKKDDPTGAESALQELLETCLKELQDGIAAIEDRLAAEDIKALEVLSLEEQKKTK